MNSGIYKIINAISGDFYIGSAVNLDKRRLEHWSALKRNNHPNCHLQRAWNKYGKSCFMFTPILVCCKEDLLIKEQECLDVMKPRYNLSPTANSVLGCKFNVNNQSRIKSGLTRRGVPKSEKWKLEHHFRMLGNTLNSGNKQSNETCKKKSERLKGNPKLKTWLGRTHTEEEKLKISLANRGKVVSDETKRKMSISAKKRWGNGQD